MRRKEGGGTRRGGHAESGNPPGGGLRKGGVGTLRMATLPLSWPTPPSPGSTGTEPLGIDGGARVLGLPTAMIELPG